MRIKTKIDALEQCFALWMWLALNPRRLKLDWPEWYRNGEGIEPYLSFCPAIDGKSIISYPYLDVCANCILKWPRNDCFSEESPYIKWNKAKSDEDRTKYALEICYLAVDAM